MPLTACMTQQRTAQLYAMPTTLVAAQARRLLALLSFSGRLMAGATKCSTRCVQMFRLIWAGAAGAHGVRAACSIPRRSDDGERPGPAASPGPC